MLIVRTIEDKNERHTTISLEMNGAYLTRSIREINTASNGSWLYPHAVDNFVTLQTTNDKDPAIQPIAQDTLVTWQLDVQDSRANEWNIAFIKMTLINHSRRTYMRKNSWERIFRLGIDDQVAPDGTLYIGTNKEGKFMVQTQPKIATSYLIKYSLDFHYAPKRRPAVYYKLDPFIQVHSGGPS